MSARATLHRTTQLLALLVALALLATITPRASAQSRPVAGPLPAFPGAEGYGALTAGGRGGRVILVTTLDDDGPGSLRAALTAAGPRIVVFRVGGVIALRSPIVVDEPFLTVAGQTAPGDGIVITGAGISLRASEIIVRGLRLRVGDASPQQVALSIHGRGGPARNIIVANSSLSWSGAELASARKAEDVSFQWNMFSESLDAGAQPDGGTAMLLAESARRVSIHHNLIAHNSYRNPLIQGDTAVDFVNNLLYNWGQSAVAFEDGADDGPTQSVIARNYFRRGPDSSIGDAVVIDKNTDGRSWIVVAGNLGDPELRVDLPLLAAGSPLPAPALPVSVEPTSALLASVLLGAGARAPARDPIDTRVVAEVRDGAGALIASPADVGGWEVLAAWNPGVAPADADSDGMPDSFEAASGLDPADPADASATAPSGYSWIEEYVNGLIPPGARHTLHLPLLRR